jgi:tight adherence protein B
VSLSPTAIINLIAALAGFGLLAGLWIAILLLVSLRRAAKRHAMDERLSQENGGAPGAQGTGRVLRLWHEGHVATMVVTSAASPSAWLMKLKTLHRSAGFEVEFKAVLVGVMGATVLAGTLMFATTHNPVLAVAGAAGVIVIAWWYLNRRINARATLFENQFIDAMGLAARSLRAGHPLLGAFQLISEELGDPVRSMFTAICQQHAMGLKLDEAINRVAAQAPHGDVKLFATAVTIQLRSGGNLAEVMERLADVVRDRVRVGRRARVLTAQTQFSKRVLIGLPIVLFLVLELLNPEYLRPLLEKPMGHAMLLAGTASLIVGAFVMNRLAVLKY